MIDDDVAPLPDHVIAKVDLQQFEYKLFLMIPSIALCAGLPIYGCLFAMVRALRDDDLGTFVMLVLAFAVTLCPIYFTNRYNRGSGVATIVFLSRWVAPFILAYGVTADCTLFTQKCVFVAVGFTRILITAFQMACRSPTVIKKHNKRKLRILLASDSFPSKIDGVATFSMNAAKRLSAAGHELHIVTSVKGPEKICGVNVTRFPGIKAKMSPGHSLTLPVPSILWTLYQFKPDIVHGLEVSPLTLGMLMYCQLADIPMSFSHHTRIDLYLKILLPWLPLGASVLPLQKFFYPMADNHLCVCTALMDSVRAAGVVTKPRRWSSGVSEEFDPRHKTAEMRNYLSGGRPDLPLVIHVGRLVLEKGSLEIPEIIMNTAKEMGKENVRFCIVGDGNLRQAVEKKIAEYGLQDIVVFTGMLFGKELYSAYASSDVFFSQSCSEAFSLVYLEAQSSRLAVVGPDVGEDFIFSDGKQGHLFAPHDPRSAGVAIKAAIEGGDRMKDEAYAHGKSFSWPRAIEELEHSLVETYKRKLESGFVGCKASKS